MQRRFDAGKLQSSSSQTSLNPNGLISQREAQQLLANRESAARKPSCRPLLTESPESAQYHVPSPPMRAASPAHAIEIYKAPILSEKLEKGVTHPCLTM